jgi:hypothetical protein
VSSVFILIAVLPTIILTAVLPIISGTDVSLWLARCQYHVLAEMAAQA